MPEEYYRVGAERACGLVQSKRPADRQLVHPTNRLAPQIVVPNANHGSTPREVLTSAIREVEPLASQTPDSDDDGFLVLAEDLAERVRDFTDRGVGFYGREDGREEIFRKGGAAPEFGESGLRFGVVASGAQGF
jgi:hypothetical protein